MTAWNVVSIDRVVDGDTVRLRRTREIGAADGLIITATDAKPVPVRLVHVDTPERGETGWAQAKADLDAWVTNQYQIGAALTLADAGRDNFGRVLGDLRTPDGDTASLHMIRDKHWPVWMETR